MEVPSTVSTAVRRRNQFTPTPADRIFETLRKNDCFKKVEEVCEAQLLNAAAFVAGNVVVNGGP